MENNPHEGRFRAAGYKDGGRLVAIMGTISKPARLIKSGRIDSPPSWSAPPMSDADTMSGLLSGLYAGYHELCRLLYAPTNRAIGIIFWERRSEMSKSVTEKMLCYLRRWNVYWTIEGNREPSELKESEEAFGALLSLVLASDKGPEVDEKFVKRWIAKIMGCHREEISLREIVQFKKMLREAGVGVLERKVCGFEEEE